MTSHENKELVSFLSSATVMPFRDCQVVHLLCARCLCTQRLCRCPTVVHEHGNSKSDNLLKMVRIVLRSSAGQQAETLPRFVTNQFHKRDSNKGLLKNSWVARDVIIF